jgi:hypothetical protein
MMLGVLLSAWLIAADARSEAVPLLADDPGYQKARGAETWFEGVLERNAAGLGATGRFNVYRLALEESGKKTTRDLYTPGKGAALALLVGKRVRVLGKLVETEVDGKTYTEVWPARLQMGDGSLPPTPGADGIYARCDWQPAEAMRAGSRSFAFRDGDALARAMRVTGTGAAPGATGRMAKLLRVTGFDWKKHMLVTVCAGLKTPGGIRLTVTGVKVVDGTLIVTYRLVPPEPSPGGFGYPAETVLVDRFDGPIRAQPVSDKKPEGK